MALVLVVDDHPVNRNLVVTLVGYRGHTVLEAPDGVEALRIAQSRHPDAVITDLMMPNMDGYELVRELRADPSLARTRVIFYTATYLRDEVQVMAEALGVSHFVAKPSDPEVLLATVDEALAVGPNTRAGAPPVESHKEYIRTVSAKLTDKVKELEAVEAALQDSEARYRSLSEFSPVGVFALDRAGRVTYTNPKLREICDLPADGSALAWTELVHADDRDRVVTALATAARDRVPYRDRVKITPLTRAMRWTDIQATPVVSNGEQSGFVGTMEDVTVAVLASDQSQELEARLQAEHIEIRLISMLDAMADALVCVDGQGRIVLVNAQTERLFGYRREELAGQPVEILLPDALRDRHPVLRARYVALPHPRPMGEGLELWARRRDGSTFRVEISLSAIDRGSEMLVMANVRDITGWLELRAERDRLMAQLEQQPRQPG